MLAPTYFLIKHYILIGNFNYLKISVILIYMCFYFVQANFLKIKKCNDRSWTSQKNHSSKHLKMERPESMNLRQLKVRLYPRLAMTVSQPGTSICSTRSRIYDSVLEDRDLSRAYANVYYKLIHGSNGKGWTVMEVTREGLNNSTRYKVKGIR